VHSFIERFSSQDVETKKQNKKSNAFLFSFFFFQVKTNKNKCRLNTSRGDSNALLGVVQYFSALYFKTVKVFFSVFKSRKVEIDFLLKLSLSATLSMTHIQNIVLK
jgi:hypothetical protein